MEIYYFCNLCLSVKFWHRGPCIFFISKSKLRPLVPTFITQKSADVSRRTFDSDKLIDFTISMVWWGFGPANCQTTEFTQLCNFFSNEKKIWVKKAHTLSNLVPRGLFYLTYLDGNISSQVQVNSISYPVCHFLPEEEKESLEY